MPQLTALTALVAVLIALLGVTNAQFIDLTNTSTPFSCLAESTSVHVPGTVPCNPYEPLQQRLAYAGSTGMTVSWSTHAQLDTPQVWYGKAPTALTNIATGSSTTYPTSRVYDNHVKLTELKPNTKYWYRTSYQLCIFLLASQSSLSHRFLSTETVLDVRTGLLIPSPLHVRPVMRHLLLLRLSSILD